MVTVTKSVIIFFRAADAILVLASLSGFSGSNLVLDKEVGLEKVMSEARRSLSLFQHHDGVTGTSKDHVMIDYAKR